MLHPIPFFVSLVFGVITVVTLVLFYWCLRNAETEKVKNKAILITVILAFWLALQGVLAIKGIYSAGLDIFPPKIILLGLLPFLLTIIILFILPAGRVFLDALPLKQITWFHVIRIPVEITLLLLFLSEAVPRIMTFEGRNLDILSGITAPFIAWLGFRGKAVKRSLLLAWNIICLLLLINIIVHALLSTPTPVQKFGFDQPNIAIFYFPFHWLPTFVAPMVLFLHLAAIRKLTSRS